ncbi:uncharacterized protein [Amphiura filiformis]|uniref:uncharacterized protein n=1 Tax=Amphiura filiformis TaxID=82378 RepID=UPI003B227956
MEFADYRRTSEQQDIYQPSRTLSMNKIIIKKKTVVPDIGTQAPPTGTGVKYGRLSFMLEEIDDVPAVWDDKYNDLTDPDTVALISGLDRELTDIFGPAFSNCFQNVRIADLFEAQGGGIGVVAGVEFVSRECGVSLEDIRSEFFANVDNDQKIGGSIYELDKDYLQETNVEEVCGNDFSCFNGGYCKPSDTVYYSSCRCLPRYSGSRCQDLIGVQVQVLIGPSPANEAVLVNSLYTLSCRRGPDGATGLIAWEHSVPGSTNRNTIFIGEEKQDLDLRYDNFAIDPDNLYDLIITNMAIEDEGTFYCRNLADSTSETSVVRTVEVAGNAPEMTPLTGGHVRVIEGETSAIVCTATGYRPVVTIEWYHKMNGGQESHITNGVTQTEGTNPGDSELFDVVSTLQYTADRGYNNGALRCVTTGQQAAPSQEKIAPLNVQYAPITNVQYGRNEIRCSSDSNPAVPEPNGYRIIINNTDEYTPTCADGVCTLPLLVDYDTDVRCNATNEIGIGTDTTVAVAGTASTPGATQGVPIAAIAVPLALIAAGSIAFAIIVLLRRKKDPQSTSDANDSGLALRNTQQPDATESSAGASAPETYTGLDPRTREQNQEYQEPQSQLSGTQSPVYEDIDGDTNTEDGAYQELGQPAPPPARDNSQAQAYVNVNQMQKGKREKRR